ncbi:hypothetical protein [Nocardia sp. NPDC005366]|uniref:hypothetical protein n=1 Tax=Nocardia sp. NPDC005366 TaxID=3156878 RepID=UPI0033A8F41A
MARPQVAALSFADAYLIALAEADPGSAVVSFDKGIDKVKSINRVEPGPFESAD